jgi:hypothetical protein
MRRKFVGSLVGGALLAAILAGPASAAQPNHQACLGNDLSSYARYGSPSGGAVEFSAGSGFGHFHQVLEGTGGVGNVIQAHMAGGVPDELLPNSCNG